jgi:hypothetical protein
MLTVLLIIPVVIYVFKEMVTGKYLHLSFVFLSLKCGLFCLDQIYF